jgi:quercetin dioxygenase-like cupin family protein
MAAIDLKSLSRPDQGLVALDANDLPWHGIGRVGIQLRDMSFRDEARDFNLRVAIGITGAQGFSPRHRHTFEQIRYYIEGPAKFGESIYHPGDCVYFPEGVAYGPQVGHNDEDSLHVTLQFAGPAGIYYPTPGEQVRAQTEMERNGTFVEGRFRHADGREQDAFEATIEHITGTAVQYPQARYDRPLRMRVPAFRALPLDGDERVTERKLATFNEVGPAIRFIEATADTTISAAAHDATDLWMLVKGSARFGERRYDGQSCFFAPSQTALGTLALAAGAQLLHVRFGAVSA